MSTFYSDVLASSRSTEPSYDSTMNINSLNTIYIELQLRPSRCLGGAWPGTQLVPYGIMDTMDGPWILFMDSIKDSTFMVIQIGTSDSLY
jgi:hypothetical protein